MASVSVVRALLVPAVRAEILLAAQALVRTASPHSRVELERQVPVRASAAALAAVVPVAADVVAAVADEVVEADGVDAVVAAARPIAMFSSATASIAAAASSFRAVFFIQSEIRS
jgi:hypothetical protein